MAYFDSSKNRALWEIELKDLRKAREDRQAGRTSGEVKKEAVKTVTGKAPIKMNYAELLREEAEATRKTPRREHMAVQKEMQKEAQKQKAAEKGRSL